MKKLLPIIMLLWGFDTCAQDGWFVQPTAGPGLGSQMFRYLGHTYYDNYVVTYDGGVLAGIQAGKWVVSTGAEYLRTGLSATTTFTDVSGNAIVTGNVYMYMYRLYFPLNAGYRISLGAKWSLIPATGLGVSWNISGKESFLPGQKPELISQEAFAYSFNPLSCFAMGKVGIEHPVSSHVSMTCAPEFDYMFTQQYRSHNGLPVSSIAHSYTMIVNLGIKWSFTRTGRQSGGTTAAMPE